MGQEQAITTTRKWLAESASVVVLTGAGVSAESGVPTFREAGGQWERFRPQDLASPEAFQRDPGFVRQWNDARLIEVNPEATPLRGAADVSLRGTSAEALPALIP